MPHAAYSTLLTYSTLVLATSTSGSSYIYFGSSYFYFGSSYFYFGSSYFYFWFYLTYSVLATSTLVLATSSALRGKGDANDKALARRASSTTRGCDLDQRYGGGRRQLRHTGSNRGSGEILLGR